MSDIEYPILADRRIGDKPLLECPYVQVSNLMRLWFVPREEENGFDFFLGQYYSSDGTPEKEGTDPMAFPHTQVECIFQGIAYFDGVRHLYMGDETEHEGYVFYPDLMDMTCALAALTALEWRLCWYVRDSTVTAKGGAR